MTAHFAFLQHSNLSCLFSLVFSVGKGVAKLPVNTNIVYLGAWQVCYNKSKHNFGFVSTYLGHVKYVTIRANIILGLYLHI
jgi:hypothetical protein